ncbi:hypothetical protein SAMN06298216_0610 [Spirosomataceae bacterium TFI 002]|nr:hypothetical protein SAMN06298216_0610 [Spirosomataceae bacterium TFI 002]
MEIQREKLQDLVDWKGHKRRKPLIINGARQVGKSWLVKELARLHFNDNIVIVNFEKNKDFNSIFKKNLDVQRIILEISIIFKVQIIPNKTLLFFDEIQECPEALISLRYFYEEMPELHLIASGSLLDFVDFRGSFPVGRVETLELQPVSFLEFLRARNCTSIALWMKTNDWDTLQNETIQKILEDEYRNYLIVGGMPECVKHFAENNDFFEIQKIQDDLLRSYEQDFKKYTPRVSEDCLLDILSNATKYLGNQIIYTKISERFTGPTIKKGLELLKTARLLQAVENVSVSGMPLTVSGKQFKIFYLDVGLLVRKSGLDFKNIYFQNELNATFLGALAEQFVAQQLTAHRGSKLNYWARTQGSASSEVDFVITDNGQIIPIEVKSGKKGSLKSLNILLEKHLNINKAIVYSKSHEGVEGKIHFVPIYYAGLSI